jgi:hypothetical protein
MKTSGHPKVNNDCAFDIETIADGQYERNIIFQKWLNKALVQK